MRENDKINLDLDLYNAVYGLQDEENETLVYFRKSGDAFNYGCVGDTVEITNIFIEAMEQDSIMLDVMTAAVDFIHENSVYCKKCEHRALYDRVKKVNGIYICPKCKGRMVCSEMD